MAAIDPMQLVDLIGEALLEFCWQALLILIAYVAARAALGGQRPRARLLAGYVALALLALTPVATVLLHWPSTGRDGVEPGPALAIVRAGLAPIIDDAPAADWQAWLVGAWAAGVLLLGLRAGWQWWQLRCICRAALPVGHDWQRRVDRLAAAFGARRPLVLESVRAGAPLLVGWLKPVILLPAGLCLRLPPDQLEMLLAHEVAHVRRLDYLANLLQVVVETVLFYHPAVHWISRRVREDRELCCDDLVAEVCHAPIDYARALLAVAERQVGTPRLALAAAGGQLLQRVERIVGSDRQPLDRRGRPLAIALALASLILLPLAWQRSLDAPLPLPLPTLQSDVLAFAAPVLGIEIRPQAPDIAPLTAAEPQKSRPPGLPLPALQRAPVEAAAVPAAATAAVPLHADALRPAQPVVAETPAIRPLHIESPVYPRVARLRGLEGQVLLAYRIRNGRPDDIEVLSESMPEMFTSAAERALRHWRFDEAQDTERRQTQLFEFSLALSPEPPCVRSTGTHICRPPAN